MKRTLMAMLCAGVVTAQLVSGKATRDALFLASLDFTSLPTMLIVASVCSIFLVALNSRAGRRIAPATLVPASFAESGLLFLLEWALTDRARQAVAVLVYLHISGAGSLLASGFWLIASERFDPRTAKKRFGQIAGAGTIGGLLSALLAERVAATLGAPAMLPVLAVFHFLGAWLVRRLALESESRQPAPSPAARGGASRSGLAVVAQTPYLRHLAALVLLGTTGAALVDYLFKAGAVQAFGRGDNLLRFFALYYAATSLITFALQASSSRLALQHLGLGMTTSTPSGALLAGSLGTLVAPGFGSLMVARAGEAIFRGSLFRAGYELFYTPIPAAEKRAAKSIIDVAFDRLGDAVGGGLVRAAMLLAPAAAQSSTILSLGMLCSGGAILAASRLNRGYIRTLENSLRSRAGSVDLSEIADGTLMLDAVRLKPEIASVVRGAVRSGTAVAAVPQAVAEIAGRGVRGAERDGASHGAAVRALSLDTEVQEILALRSRDRERVVAVLHKEDGLTPALVPHVIPLLAWDAVAADAVFALRKVAEERVGEFIDALIDPNQDFAVRRRLARVFSVCVSQRAADGLMLGLEDLRFDVRCQCGRSLAAIVEKNPRIHIRRKRVFAVIAREVAVGRPVWESRRLIDEFDEGQAPSVVDSFVRDRAGESLAHVFTLLSLVLQREPLQIAFRSLHTDDKQLQGTALEYLEEVLPAPIRQRLWPFLEHRPVARPARPRDEIISDLLRSHHSILLNLEELKRRSGTEQFAS